jgi:hypothetical protein
MNIVYYFADSLLYGLGHITPQHLMLGAACVVLLYFVHHLWQR